MKRVRIVPPGAAVVRGLLATIGALLLAACAAGGRATGPERAVSTGTSRHAAAPIGRAAAESLNVEALRFHPPAAERFTLSNGVTVFFMEDRTLPLVNAFALFRGGPSYFDRSDLAAATAVGASLLLSGGTLRLPPDSVDRLVDFYALAPSFSTGGASSFTGIESLSRHIDLALSLWVEMLATPRFDPERVENWRLRELETVKWLEDSPGSLAISEFNHLLFGDHPIGWQLGPSDLEPERLAPERLRRVHREVFCKDNLTLGIVGDLSRDEARARLEAAFAAFPACPRKLEAPRAPELRQTGGVYVVHKEVNQSSLVLGQPGGILQKDDPEYYAAQVANWILGGGGLSSRLTSRVRTQEGLAYSAGTVWGAGTRHERAFGAFTQTRAEATIATARLIRDVLAAARDEPPTAQEVRLAVDYTVNGFVFAFEDPAAMVMRQMAYAAGGLPEDWLERYVAGIQRVTPTAVHEVVRRHIHPGDWTIVIVGDTTKFDAPPSALGPLIRR
jgi:predicted Zn-dependent peptidase